METALLEPEQAMDTPSDPRWRPFPLKDEKGGGDALPSSGCSLRAKTEAVSSEGREERRRCFAKFCIPIVHVLKIVRKTEAQID
ncbi:hypothetical protein JRQ81_012095 [Phrynocephalus forsythii]|uniref:Uncharacterized protein n=1 Tax=Phrynocephalus forsythii TaxID=171643 RepID=A0A9Q1AQ77_9SAUR|nr:hypothetical protein JRQ81_012095 [Phrynocephalus forsythii]